MLFLKQRVVEFLDVVVEKYDIKSYADFRVEELRKLAIEVGYFDEVAIDS